MQSCPETLVLYVCVCPASAARKAESFQSWCCSTTVSPGGIYPVTQQTGLLESAVQAAATPEPRALKII